ncbi:DNA replication/repair protein RecF [Anaplasma phagocytophilum str. Norway variant1]|uniref:DNA replication and repair protein RecF n=1 Tax=Anaplasma phagocytophilum str. Norway variant1 TaxID=1392506 RepID=A0A7H9E1L1_ANAPH|nr:DNA replication/repair protein RecF [Anaplasma phagocytophilum]QLL67216.1 DNA replication/repair protein RecF [Anaplasma phagocytophilum str. Norway variant1]
MSCKFQSYVQGVKLVNFRNYSKVELESNGKSVVLLGENGVGKTNILEAVSLLSKGPGLRNVSADCMQNSGTTIPWLVHYNIVGNGEFFSVDITKKNNKRSVTIDEKASLYSTLHKILCILWLVPQLDHILLKAPTERLRFFDRMVHIFDKDYSLHMVKYEKAKRDRKKILQESPHNHHWLSSLEEIMSTSGVHIAKIRQHVLETLHATLAENSSNSTFFKFIIRLESKVFELLDNPDKAVDAYAERLRSNRNIDAARQCTTFGVHNDNFQVFNEKKDLVASSCSTGEQKILLLSLLLTAATAKHKIDGQAPIMLLDDIMSHLDPQHRKELMSIIEHLGCQVWITDVDEKNFEGFRENFQYFYVANNNVCKM